MGAPRVTTWGKAIQPSYTAAVSSDFIRLYLHPPACLAWQLSHLAIQRAVYFGGCER
jgi:hypothetical protein